MKDIEIQVASNSTNNRISKLNIHITKQPKKSFLLNKMRLSSAYYQHNTQNV